MTSTRRKAVQVCHLLLLASIEAVLISWALRSETMTALWPRLATLVGFCLVSALSVDGLQKEMSFKLVLGFHLAMVVFTFLGAMCRLQTVPVRDPWVYPCCLGYILLIGILLYGITVVEVIRFKGHTRDPFPPTDTRRSDVSSAQAAQSVSPSPSNFPGEGNLALTDGKTPL